MRKMYLFLGIILVFLIGCAEDVNIKGLIEKANYCNSADECIVVQFDCPFGCNNIVNKNSDIDGIKEIIKEYNGKTAQICVSDCMPAPKSFDCVNDKCIAKETKINDDLECVTDSDCSTGGCSGEICGKKGEVENIMSTCDYRPEYECYKKTSCGCVDGMCGWEGNEEYYNCLSLLDR